MSISIADAVSRPLGVAQRLRQAPIEESSVYAKIVVLTGAAATLDTANGRWCFLDALALLSRVVGHLVVALPANCALSGEVTQFCTRAWSRGSVTMMDADDFTAFDRAQAILNVGNAIRKGLPWTTINSNGWVARASSSLPLPLDTDKANPVAALMAAAFGVTEVFKRVFDIPPEVAPLLDRTEFSLYELTVSPSDVGPQLPRRLFLPDTLLTGAGAISNGIALLLSQLSCEGRLHVIDQQDYRDENLGTCLLTDSFDWIHRPKAQRLSAWLSAHSRLAVTGEKIDIQTAIAQNRFGGLKFDLVLNGLDDIEARRETQRLWPSDLIDGGINEVGAAVIQHRGDRSDQGCLLCWFEPPEIDERILQSRWTGLHRGTLGDGGRLLTDADIMAARPDKQPWLRECQHLGKKVCSIITEAQLAYRLGITVSDGFRPSVPFVAAGSAALVVAAAVKALAFREALAPSMFQIGSLFLGPEHSALVERLPAPSCHCVVHRDAITRVQSARKRLHPCHS